MKTFDFVSRSCFLSAALFLGTGIFAQSKPGINTANMDVRVLPSNDFFRYVNGSWLDKTEIPADKVRWGSFDELRLQTDKDMLDIIANASNNKQYSPGTDQRKALSLYETIMDTVSRSKNSISPLKPYLTQINAIATVADLEKFLAQMEPLGGVGFFGINVGPDAKNSNRNVVNISPGPVGLPDRDYYISDDKDSKEKREKYRLHLTKMLQLLGESPTVAASNANRILSIETAMSQPRLDRVERRDRRKTYNPTAIGDLSKLSSAINWKSYLNSVGVTGIDSVNVAQPKYIASLDGLFKNFSAQDWKAYLRWTLLNKTAAMLSTETERANWEFYGKTLTGTTRQRPLNERALQAVNGSVGEALGKLYVEKKFPAEAKAKAASMISNIMKAYENRISNLSWMGSVTKQKAIQKLNTLNIKIGYPDEWTDFSALKIHGTAESGTYFNNAMNVTKWAYERSLQDLKKPVNKKRWRMNPQTVNAYYNPSANEIVFPAAILQPPFYDFRADEAVNYGGIGGVIGHEISHGFDDSGSRYNADGNLLDWWTAEDLQRFNDLTGALAAQYSALEPIKGTFVDGKFTLGENIGDLGGVNAAYDGLQLFLRDNPNQPLIDGFTPEERFFISWATIWRSKQRDEALKNQVKTDPHSPGMYRAYVPLQNIDAFYDAFKIKSGNGMYLAPEKRVKIW